MSKNYNTQSTYSISGALIKDPESETFKVTKGANAGKTVTRLKLTLADSTKSERHATIFPEFYVEGDARVAFLSKLKKGDFVRAEGKPEVRVYVKKNGEPGFSFEIRFPRVVEPLTYLGDRDETPKADDSAQDDSPGELVSPY